MEKTLDWELAKQLAGGDETLAKELHGILLDSLPEYRQEITTAFEKNDIKELAKSVHKLHGAACYCGTPKLKTAAKNLELTARENKTDQINPLYKTLCQEIDAVLSRDINPNL